MIMMPLKSSSRQKMIVGVGHHHFVGTSGSPLGGSHPNWLDDLENCWADDNEHKESLKREYFVTYAGQKTLQYLLTINSGLTGYFSSVLEDFTTFPLLVTFLAFFSLAFLICGVLGILTAVELLLTGIQVLADWARFVEALPVGWILLELPTQHKLRGDRATFSPHLPVTFK